MSQTQPMSQKSRRVLIAAAVLVLALATGLIAYLVAGRAASDDASVGDPAKTTFPGLQAASGDPTPSAMLTASPAAGTVSQVSGPFDDRFTMTGLRYDEKTVTGKVTITSDVSDLLDLQVVAGLYDRSGRLIGTSRWTYHASEGHEGPSPSAHAPQEAWPFTIAVPAALRGQVAAVTVGVPILVNE